MLSTVEGKLSTRFYEGAKCPEVHNSVDWYPSSGIRIQVSTLIDTEILLLSH